MSSSQGAAGTQTAVNDADNNGTSVNGSLPNDPAAERREHLRLLAISIACYFAFGVIVPSIQFRPHRMPLPITVVIAIGPTLIFMLLQVWIPWCFVRIRQSLTAEIKEAAVFGVLWLLLVSGFAPHKGDTVLLVGSITTLTNMVQTLALSVVGSMIARVVREAKLLLPLGVIAGLIDIVGAMTPVGFTAHMVQSHPEVVSKVSVHVPTMAGLHIGTMIGPGDPLFIAFFFAVVHQHRLNTRWTFGLVYTLLTLSMIAVQLRFVPAVGALAPMGIAVIIANWNYFSFTREEKFAMLYAGLISVAGAVGFFFYTNAHIFRHRQSAPTNAVDRKAPANAAHRPAPAPAQ